jgi:glycosyltransferase involved in cell wall biosynthesis
MPELTSYKTSLPPTLKPDAGTAKELPSVSVTICCHNGAARLPATLQHIAIQQGCEELTWEILIIDNASTDETASVVQQFSAEHPELVVRVVNEPRLGNGYARQRGMKEARHDIILFVDDDNWISPNYLRLVAEVMGSHPEITGLGGMSTAECECAEPNWLPKYQGWYAVTGAPNGMTSLTEETFLWTAGTAFRRVVLDRLHGSFLMSGRRGDSLDGGEDDELSFLIRLSGGRLCRYSGLHFRHYMPAKRLTWDYLRRLHYAAGLVSVKLDRYRFATDSSPWPKWILQSWVFQMCNVSLQILRYRLLVARAEKSHLEGSDAILRQDLYRGRFQALWSARHGYRQMLVLGHDSVHQSCLTS